MQRRSYERFKSWTARVRTSGTASLLWLVALASAVTLAGCTGMVNADNKSANSAIKVSPSTVNFGNTGVGRKVSHPASITNTSTESVTLKKAMVSDSEFSISGLRFPITIAAGQKANFTVWYQGSKPGKHHGQLGFDGGSSDPPPIDLTGSAGSTPPSLDIAEKNHDFGKVTINTEETATIPVSNSGGAALNISQVSVSGSGFNATGIKQGDTVAAGGNAVLIVTFKPTATKSYSGTVSISSNDPDTPVTTVSLTGAGNSAPAGKLTASPANLTFSSVKAGTSATATTNLKNTGNANLTLSQVVATGNGFSATGVSAPVSLAPGDSVNLNVKFSPTATGSSTGHVSLATSEGTVTVNLAGTATAADQPGLSVSPGSISFGSVVTNVTNTQTVQLKNTGTAAVTISTANVTGTGFSTTGLNLPLTLNPGQSSTFSVQFGPKTAGGVTGTLSLASNAPDSPDQVSLSGTGVAEGRTLSANPGSLSFGNVTVSNTSSKNITVTNTGNSDVAISSITLSGSKFTLNGGSAVTLSPSQSTTLSVSFAPTATGSATGSISIASNATGSPASVSLSGNGVNPVSHTVALSWNSSAGATGYNVYRSTSSGGGYSRLNTSPDGGLSYTDSNVQSGQTYFYVTTAVNGAGTESNFSSEVTAAIP